jgi:predicted DNA-binding transcriptional regulator AlpA
MDFLTIEELAKASGKSRRTVDRKIQAFEKSNPDQYKLLVKHPSEGTRILYSPELLSMLGLNRELIDDVKKEVLDTEPKPKRVTRPKPPKINIAQVISVNQLPESIEKDMADFNLIMEDYKTGEFTLPECIERHSVKQSTFFYWINTRPEFNELYTEVYELHKRSFNILMRELAKGALKKMVTGYDRQLESVTFKELISPTGQSIRIPQERKTYQKHFSPNGNLVAFALTNKDPDEWKRYFNPNDPEKGKPIDPLDQMSDAELFQIVDEARRSGLLTAGDVSSPPQV